MISVLRFIGVYAVCLGLFWTNGASASTPKSSSQDTFPCVYDQCSRSSKEYCDKRENVCRSCLQYLQKYYNDDFSQLESQCVKYYVEDLEKHHEGELKKSRQTVSEKSETIRELEKNLTSMIEAVRESHENLRKKDEQLRYMKKELAEKNQSEESLRKDLAEKISLLHEYEEKDARFFHGSGAEILLIILLVITVIMFISAAVVYRRGQKKHYQQVEGGQISQEEGHAVYKKCQKKPDLQNESGQISQDESANLLSKKNKEESTSDYSLSTVSGGEEAAPKDGDQAECPSPELEEVKVQDARQRAVCENGYRVRNPRYDPGHPHTPRTEMAPEQDFQELHSRANHDNSVQSINYRVPNTQSEQVNKNLTTKTPAFTNIININFDTDKNVSGNRDKSNSSNGAGNTELCDYCKSGQKNGHHCQSSLMAGDTNCSSTGCPLAKKTYKMLTSVNPTTPESK